VSLSLDWATARVLAVRDVVRFFRQRSRVVGALAQPILFWWVIGSGFRGSFHLEGADHVRYDAYFFPGVVTMVLLFSAIFATITVIEDRREGFLQCVLAGPGSRFSVVAGKCLGSSAVALIQASLFLGLAPLAGVNVAAVNGLLLCGALVLTALFLTALGFSLAWWINSAPGYHAVMSVVLIPMWVLSGAMFPLDAPGSVLGLLMRLNPMRFSVDAIRQALFPGDGVSSASGISSAPAASLAVLAALAATALGVAAWGVSRRE
jgi:ABC-2 type transport system permease protein